MLKKKKKNVYPVRYVQNVRCITDNISILSVIPYTFFPLLFFQYSCTCMYRMHTLYDAIITKDILTKPVYSKPSPTPLGLPPKAFPYLFFERQKQKRHVFNRVQGSKGLTGNKYITKSVSYVYNRMGFFFHPSDVQVFKLFISRKPRRVRDKYTDRQLIYFQGRIVD